MLSRIFWVGIAGLALIAGIALQDGDWMFGSHDTAIDRSIDRTVDRTVDRVVDGSVDRMEIVDRRGNEIAVPAEMKRAFGEAVGRLVKAEADLAILGIRGGDDARMVAATVRRDQARTEVETLKAQIAERKLVAAGEQDVNDQVEQQIRDEVRASIRDAVRN